METRASKRKKLIVQQEKEVREITRDRISDLPDCILNHILSLLPFQLIAQTSVLSKRWEQLWRSYPCLDFSTFKPHIQTPPTNPKKPISSTKLHDRKTKAWGFVTRVLARRQENSNIKVFRLNGYVSFSCLHDWIRRLVKFKVEELELEVFLSDHFDLPRCLFASESLKILTLSPKDSNPQPETPNVTFRFPTSLVMNLGGLQTLQTLVLTCIEFMSSLQLDNLFSGSTFPSLEKLYLKECLGISHLYINCPKLEDVELVSLQLNGLDLFGERLEALSVTRSMKNSSGGTWVKIFTPKLKYFLWEYNQITEKFCMETFGSLCRARMHYKAERLSAARLSTAASLFSVFSFGRHLYLNVLALELLAILNSAGGPPISFKNLKNLELTTGLNKCEIQGMACLLRSCPKLETLKLVIHNSRRTAINRRWNLDALDNLNFSEEEYWESQSEAFKSLQSNVKVVNVIIVGDVVHESAITLIRFLLKHGNVLRELALRLCDSLQNEFAPQESLKKNVIGRIMEIAKSSCNNTKLSLLGSFHLIQGLLLSSFSSLKSLELHTGLNKHNILKLANQLRGSPTVDTLQG